MTLREKLIVLRDKAGISQMSLAHQLDVSRQAVSRWESGDTTPSMDKLKALAKIYGVSLDWLCSDSDMADEKPTEVVSPLEENETKNTTVSAKDIQFSTTRSGTRSNSRTLFVTRIISSNLACAAISISCCTMLRGFIDRKNSCRSITARIIGVAGGYRHSLSNRG